MENNHLTNLKEARKAGYLVGSFRLFYLKGLPEKGITPHYHDFHKLILLIDGRIGYGIEGVRYTLMPDDAVFVPAGAIHVPELADTAAYERLIIYLSPQLEKNGRVFTSEGLPDGFLPMLQDHQQPHFTPVRRLMGEGLRIRKRLIQEMTVQDPVSRICRYALLLELLCEFSRSKASGLPGMEQALSTDPVIRKSVAFISLHLAEESLNIDEIARRIPVSRSYLMHQFKKQMGCTIGEYITEKRLYEAGRLLADGVNVTEACFQSGFKNYSAFYYAHKKKYGVPPSMKVRRTELIRE